MKFRTTPTLLLAAVMATQLAACASLSDLGAGPGLQRTISEAESGDADQQLALGVHYLNGDLLARDNAAANRWLRAAAEQGQPQAQFLLGVNLSVGQGVDQDQAAAVAWWERAARAGYDRAQFQLGEAYLNGRGVKRDPAWAARWFGKAARQGHADAQFTLGVAYASGLGLPRHGVESVKWLTLAERSGQPQAAEVRAKVASTLTAPQAREAQRRVRKYRSRPDGGTRDRPTIRYVQLTLSELGYETGPVDGIPGEQTRVAISDYRANTGMGGGSDVNVMLLARLRGEGTG